MEDKAGRKEIALLALAGVAALGGGVADSIPDTPRPDHAPDRRRRCHDMKKKRKRQMVKASRRRNR